MLDALIISKTRIKLLMKFFLNSATSSYLRDLESDFQESTNAIRIELNRFEKAGLLTSSFSGNKKMFFANTRHPLFNDIHRIIIKHVGIDTVTEEIINKLGGLKKVYLTGSFSRGIDSHIIDIVLIGEDIDKNYLLTLVEKAEKLIHRKVRYMLMLPEEYEDFRKEEPEAFLLWEM
jgi:predicted nucleotidyltransferase